MKGNHYSYAQRALLTGAFVLLWANAASASVFGDVRGIIRDPQRHTVSNAKITLRSRSSDFVRLTQSDAAGEFTFRTIPIGEYAVTVESSGFAKVERAVTVISDSAPVLQFSLEIAPVSQTVEVTTTPALVGSDSPTPTTLISREQIARTPGANRTNSLALITDYVPGAYVTHNQLHIRGGHQVTWLIDGVPVPNTNIADTVGPQFDPKDIDYLEVQRGSYSAEFGDRTYGVFNVVPRSGFERNREGELLLSFGNFHQTDNQVNFGDHTERFAYYASLSGNRSDYGLETPTTRVLHDAVNGVGGFGSFIFNANPSNQFRLVTALRRDFYQVPNDPDAQAVGIRDVERERDGFINFSWVHTFNPKLTFTASPFYHYNRAAFIGDAHDTPISTRDERISQYAGAQAVLSLLTNQHNAKVGFYGFYQHDVALFGLQGTNNDGSLINIEQRVKPTGNLEAIFIEDQYKPLAWLTFTGGVRLTRFHGSVTENATSPRAGVAIRLPRTNIVLHGFYGRYYQAPPLSTVSGTLLDFALNQGLGFIPLRGERDEEYQGGVTIPLKGWAIETSYFHTKARKFFDHAVLGNSNIFLPLTIARARFSGFETTVRSPLLLKRARVYLAYSNQRAQGRGGITGGLTDFTPPDNDGYFYLDHDQRHTLNVNFNVALMKNTYIASSVHYGSGFLDGNGPQHLPDHTTFDVALGKSFGENWKVALQVVNVSNHRYLLDNSNTFGGTHFVEPRQIYVELRRRFKF